jgi:hypothetical protein
LEKGRRREARADLQSSIQFNNVVEKTAIEKDKVSPKCSSERF